MMAVTGLSRLGQVSMTARDLDRAVRFYRDTLGLPFIFTAPPRLAFFDCGGVRLMLDIPERPPGDPSSTSRWTTSERRIEFWCPAELSFVTSPT